MLISASSRDQQITIERPHGIAVEACTAGDRNPLCFICSSASTDV